jgi:hypothetical protein
VIRRTLALSSCLIGLALPAMAQSLTPVKVLLDWAWLPYHTTFLVAQEKGYYREAGLDVQLEQTRSGLRVHCGQLDPEALERRDQLVEEPTVPADLVHAVADPARRRRTVLVPDPDLVLDRRHHLEAETVDVVEHAAQHLARSERERAVGPARRREADAPARSPRKLVQRVGVGAHDQIGCAHPDAEALVVGDRRVDRVEPDDQVGHHGPVLYGSLEGGRAERLAAERAVHVGDREEHELLAGTSVAHPSLTRRP